MVSEGGVRVEQVGVTGEQASEQGAGEGDGEVSTRGL